MTAPTTVPLTITPDAAEQISRLGLQAEFERMVEHVREAVPRLHRIEVSLYDRCELGAPDEPPGIAIHAYRGDPYQFSDPTDRDLRDWFLTSFPPDVGRYFLLRVRYEPRGEGVMPEEPWTFSLAVPVTVTLEATQRVWCLGMRAELEQMLRHACEMLPGLLRLEVEELGPFTPGDEPRIAINAFQEEPQAAGQWEYGTWLVATFPPDVWQQFSLWVLPGVGHAR
jgi:hypothetical protein